MSDYRLFAWGANSHDQLGLGDISEEEILVPREVDLSHADLNPEKIRKIVGGAGHSLILDDLGRVYTCGWNDKGQAGLEESSSRFQRLEALEAETIVDLACGWDFSLALTSHGEIFVWGSNVYGQLGLSRQLIPNCTSTPTKLQLAVPVKQMAAGLRHSALVTQDSKLLVSGAATKSQLGVHLPDSKCSDQFIQVPELENVKSVSCGQHHTIIVTRDQQVYAWGDNKYGQLGIDQKSYKTMSTPREINNCSEMTILYKIYCGWTHSVLLTADRNVFLWGRNTYGQLGRTKNATKYDWWEAINPRTLTKIQQISVGSEHNVALDVDGTVMSWGWNEHGNCGNGSKENILAPTKVMLPKGKGVLVGSGAGHSFAVLKINC